jgi:hypothetical protein
VSFIGRTPPLARAQWAGGGWGEIIGLGNGTKDRQDKKIDKYILKIGRKERSTSMKERNIDKKERWTGNKDRQETNIDRKQRSTRNKYQ